MFDDIGKDWGCLAWTIAIIGCLALLAGVIWLDVFLATWAWCGILVPTFGLPTLSMWQMFCVKIAIWLCLPTRTTTVKTK